MAPRAWQRLGQAVTAFCRTLLGQCANADCIGSDRLDRLLSTAPVVLYVLRWPDMVPVFVSDNIVRFTGLAPELPSPEPNRWQRYIHPDDRDICVQALRNIGQQGRFSIDHRLRHAEGGWRWVRNEARLILDEHSMPVEIVGSMLDMTERHAFEEALAASETQLRAAQALLTDAIESSGDAFSLFDAEDRLQVFNSRYKEIYPTIADDIRPGVPFVELLRLSAQRGQYKDVPAEQAEEWVRERMAHHHAASGVLDQQLADGRSLEIIERPTTGGGRVAVRRDVTARKRIEDALRRELAFEQTLIDALPFPVFFKGRDGHYLGCSTKFAEAMGRTVLSIIGRTVYDLLPEKQAAEYTATDEELFANPGVQTREITMQWSDGSIHRLNVVKGTFTDASGQVAGYIGSFIDITQQKRAEEQLVQAAKLATLGQIASEVAHELNQPLSIIRMSAEMCQQLGDSDRERRERKLSTIVTQVSRMAEIVDHLRSFSRLESGEMRPFAPATVLNTVVRLLSPHFQLDDIALEVDVPPDCPDIRGQPNQMEQVLLNLLSNARDAVRAHHPHGKGRVRVRLWAEDEWVNISVHDNGGGIPDAMWAQVFEPFFTTKGAGIGTGLGLSISANIMNGMGGRITGCNMGEGAFFRISIPADKSDGDARRGPAPCGPAAPCEPAPPDAAPHGRVLVVDDEELAVECIADYLQARGFDVLTATSPERALEAARQTPVDLLITDLRLPGMSGSALTETLRRDHPDLPAILMTGGPTPANAASIYTEILPKPLALADLARHARHLLRERSGACVP